MIFSLNARSLTWVLGLFTCTLTLMARALDAPSPDHPKWAAALNAEGTPFTVYLAKRIYTMDPLLGVWTAVNRFAEVGKTVMAPGERIGIDRALRAVTIDAAYVPGMEDRVGSLEPGKFADFAILEEDPCKVNPKHLKDIPVWGTALSGKLFQSDR